MNTKDRKLFRENSVMGDNFVYSKKDVVLAGVATVIIVTLLGVGFGVTSGASIQEKPKVKSS